MVIDAQLRLECATLPGVDWLAALSAALAERGVDAQGTRIGAVFLYRPPIDFRKSIGGLSALVEQELGLNPFGDALYLFINRRRRPRKATGSSRCHSDMKQPLNSLVCDDVDQPSSKFSLSVKFGYSAATIRPAR